MTGDSSRAASIVDSLSALGVDVRPLGESTDITDPSVVALVDLRNLAEVDVTADAALEATGAALDLARAVDARPEPLRVVVLSALDGRHGFAGGEIAADAPVQAATVGFWKCVAKEWRHHHVRCLDVAPVLEPDAVASHIAAEIAGEVPGDDLEHGLDGEGLWGVDVVAAPTGDAPGLDGDAVVLAVGGAQGIGADILTDVVAAPGRTIVLVGRTDPAAALETPAVAAADGEGAIRAALIQDAQDAGQRPLPADIEKAIRPILSARRVRDTINRLEAAGAAVEYHALDARDPAALTGLVGDVLERRGRLDLVVHAAGVIADAPVARKDRDSIAPVLTTKIVPALALCDAVPPQTAVVFFGSVAGRFGNASQADYGAANEFLAKLAAVRSSAGGDVRCIAWGPWDSGMVSSSLLAVYDAIGIVPIAADPGAAAFGAELAASPVPEVVLANSTSVMAGLRWPPTAASILGS